MRLIVLACAATAGASLLLPSVLTYDPWIWVIWGRELIGGQLHTGTLSTWKPGPVLVTAPLALLGGAAPAAWIVVARAGGLLALALAYRLAARLAGPLAGLLAVLALALSEGWVRYLAHGNSEPLLVALVLAAALRALDGAHGQAYALAIGAALLRVEAWPFLGLYALWRWRAEPERRLSVAVGLALVPLLWFVPEWLSSGDPFGGAQTALSSREAQGTARAEHPALAVLERGTQLVVAPVLYAAAAAALLGLARRQGRVLALAGGVLAWVGVVVGMQALGYPGIARFMVPAAALACVLAGVGLVEVARLAPRRGLAVLVGAALLALATPAAVRAVDAIGPEARTSQARLVLYDDLRTAVARLGGARTIRRRGQPCINRDLRPALGWLLDLRPDTICTQRGGLLLLPVRRIIFAVVPSSLAGPTPLAPYGVPGGPRLLASAGPWRVVVARPEGSVLAPTLRSFARTRSARYPARR